jgi:small subunit ribosomal protein S17
MSDTEQNQDERGTRRTIVGTITSNKMDKTIVVSVTRRVRDARFHKFLTRRLKYKAHDEKNVGKIGDLVELVEARPMSKTKRWRLFRTISHAIDSGDVAVTNTPAKAAPAATAKKAK